MENGIRIRNIIFEQLMNNYACNRKHWEMLCSSDKPLVPFIGAGISAWCYPTWNELLTGIVKDKFNDECANIVKRALGCKSSPNVKTDGKHPFYWMEEIAECIFDYDENSYKANERRFPLPDEDNDLYDEDSGSCKEAEKPSGSQLLQEIEGAKSSEQILTELEFEISDLTEQNTEWKDHVQTPDPAPTQEQILVQEPGNTMHREEDPDMILRQLRDNVGTESPQLKLEAVEALYQKFDSTLLKEKRMPEYQKFFHRIFSDILVTTNYDRALECCYPSLFSYSYIDLNENYDKGDRESEKPNEQVDSKKEKDKDREKNKEKDKNKDGNSWLFKVVNEKLTRASSRMNGQDNRRIRLSVPDNPMLLKVHGSIEHADEIALTASKYENVYNNEVKKLLELIFEKSTLIFLGSGLRSDRYLDELKKYKERSKKTSKIQHFAFLCISEEESNEESGYEGEDEKKEGEKENKEEEKKRKEEEKKKEENARVEELKSYGIYPIFYAPDDLKELVPDADERKAIFHDYFLGLFMENLSRRKMYYPQPLELLWDKERFEEKSLKEYLADVKRDMLMQRPPQIVHRTEAQQIWNLLNFSSDECPLIAVTGSTGSGRSALCQCIPELSRDYKDTMQFFYIPLAHCTRWDEFCMQLFEKMNIVKTEIPEIENWREAAQLVTERCSGYWRSVLILDQLDDLKEDKNPLLWDTIKKILWYWKEQQTRVIFTCREYPQGISCYTWHIGELEQEEAKMVFFSACTSKRYRNISYLEQMAVSELFSRQSFQPASAHLLGKYANSKNDLNSLLEEWELYHQPGDNEEQVLARMLVNYLLAEHEYDKKEEERENIRKNILWVWGILDTYPGVFPSVFFQSALEDNTFTNAVIDKHLTEKTLRYMKNAGLCEESCDEQKSILLKNLVVCVRKYFFEIDDMDDASNAAKNKVIEDNKVPGDNKVPENRIFAKLYGDFEEKLAESEQNHSGLECFRGYTMDNYHGELRRYVLLEYGTQEQKNETKDVIQVDQTMEDIKELLDCLGKQVEDDQGRKTHKALNLVLHYEIRLVVRFLYNYLAKLKTEKDEKNEVAEAKKKRKEEIAQIGYRFAHYFHYIPSYAFPFAKQLLEIMEKNHTTKQYELANMNRVMGDIQRLLGKKTESDRYYKQALALCDSQMLEIFSMDQSQEDFVTISTQCKRIRAATLLISNDYDSLCRMPAENHPGKIYKSIDDVWGQAHYNQRMGEMLFDANGEPRVTNNIQDVDKDPILKKQKDTIEKIIEYYNEAAKLYTKTGSKTGTAYILKCMGDLIEKYRLIYGGHKLEEVEEETSKEIYYKIGTSKDGEQSSWTEDAAKCYRQAFICYYGHINWRGFANVIQAMGTTYRISCEDIINSSHMKNVGKLYGFAEECYRWLGDVRGLADTLDYFGYGYRDCKDDDNKYRHMALSKWMESREMWKDQGNDWKADNIKKEINNLRSKLKEEAEGLNGQTGTK